MSSGFLEKGRDESFERGLLVIWHEKGYILQMPFSVCFKILTVMLDVWLLDGIYFDCMCYFSVMFSAWVGILWHF